MIQVKKLFYIIFCLSIFDHSHAQAPKEEIQEMRGGDRPSFHVTPRPARKTNHSSPRTTPTIPDIAELTIIILVQASNNLESFAHKNMKEIMKWGSTPHVNILVDLHKTGDKSWRYKIEQGCLVVEEVLARDTAASITTEVIDTARWAITKYPAKKYAIIFWNHGLGCLDPIQDKNKTTHLQPYNDFWRLAPLLGPQSTEQHPGEYLSRALAHSIPADRSILFDDERNTYLSNEGLNTALKTISEELLGGKKIDLIGMDACLMGMIEIADQIKDYAAYFVASEEFEFAQGWPYGDIIGKIIAQPTMNPKDLGKLIVNEFGAHYSNRTSYFTLACIDLSYIQSIKECIHALSQTLLVAKKTDPERMRLFIQQARCQALSFSLSDYVDTHSFCKELIKLSTYVLDNPRNKTTPTPQISIDVLKKIQALTTQITSLINTAVVANTTGRYLSRAGGLSIYFPQRIIDRSYGSTIFAQTTEWPLLIAAQLDKR